MTKDKMEKLMPKLTKVYSTALSNYSYFAEASRVCESLKESEVGINAGLGKYLKKLCKQNEDISNCVLKIVGLYGHLKGKVDGVCLLDELVKELFLIIDAFEQDREDVLLNADFRNYIEPMMGKYFKNLVKDEEKTEKAKEEKTAGV